MLAECYYRYVAVGPLAPEIIFGGSCRKTWWSLLLYIDFFVNKQREVGSLFSDLACIHIQTSYLVIRFMCRCSDHVFLFKTLTRLVCQFFIFLFLFVFTLKTEMNIFKSGLLAHILTLARQKSIIQFNVSSQSCPSVDQSSIATDINTRSNHYCECWQNNIEHVPLRERNKEG